MSEVDGPAKEQRRAMRPGLRRSDSGAAAVEYALLAGMIAVTIVGSLAATGTNLSSSMNKVEQAERLTVSTPR